MIKAAKYWTVPNITGYMPVTTYWNQLTKLEEQNNASEETFCMALRKWLTDNLKKAQEDYKAFTELVMVLNHKCWDHCNMGQHKIGKLYSDFFYKTQNWGYKHLKGEQLTYFFNTLD